MSAPRKHLPPVFGTAELAAFLGWSTERVRRWCERNGIGRRCKDRQRLEITYSQILEKCPDVYYALLAAGAMEARAYVGGDFDDGEGGED